MALAKFDKYITSTTTGATVPSASVQVNRSSTGQPASLFSDREGNNQITNPTTADPNGRATFYYEADRYNITASSGGFSVDYTDVVAYPAPEEKADTSYVDSEISDLDVRVASNTSAISSLTYTGFQWEDEPLSSRTFTTADFGKHVNYTGSGQFNMTINFDSIGSPATNGDTFRLTTNRDTLFTNEFSDYPISGLDPWFISEELTTLKFVGIGAASLNCRITYEFTYWGGSVYMKILDGASSLLFPSAPFTVGNV